ncbi:unnamed protein product [Didymodactylos carnosus]|uniref:RING-type domain-containing protein n=1 Tax=Didymodactylos carnosus TaxID=1234261 RepID=A0A814NDF1_9BILA|nr:unnamed protein product [Didymodactylos carnosus]CAF1089971.1 unnamed protein product [Didymodactylos carnosus]CAF3764166.1 unnamed protein product [Didymodactylos carnosus]CAF3855491.1 unnamed protein product [Didymodactylos carnosus]
MEECVECGTPLITEHTSNQIASTKAAPSTTSKQMHNEMKLAAVTQEVSTPVVGVKASSKPPMPLIEKPMDDLQLKWYYDQHQWVMKSLKQQSSSIDIKRIRSLIEQLYMSNEYQPRLSQPLGQLSFSICQICLDPQSKPLIEMITCRHQVICRDCYQQYLSIRIRDGEVMPWIPCPGEVCPIPLSCQNLIYDGQLSVEQLLEFCQVHMSKKLNRNENFVPCTTQSCYGGFLQLGQSKKEQVTCRVCKQEQTIEKGKVGDLDDTFKNMIVKGVLRECPSCKHLTLKEKGLCNVIECAKCSIWWNWATREMGHDARDLKERARMHGTLWEPGELLYQLDLQRRNPEEFKALLERNGIQYDPNYVRGSKSK